ncbi:hypothetical protein [Flexilinea flocculi]|uniref:Uncharacterized protein n=1 Tax=Flexilinea flocculi TaxID=1678840 RepID=A0A0K8P986_9CHLR|nr:hypothetical protein [Flexilinea flocculi]GAP39089.1 hypothetical protein ATC1_118 [Flexilinea flocculi]
MNTEVMQIKELTKRITELEQENVRLHNQLQAAYRAFRIVNKTTQRVSQSRYWHWILALYAWRDRALPAGSLTIKRILLRR